ncbi:hypothetical protein [Amycolatopsis jejuensis]|nr:hypothetical protein [Amycolatopsis jejuensis]
MKRIARMIAFFAVASAVVVTGAVAVDQVSAGQGTHTMAWCGRPGQGC